MRTARSACSGGSSETIDLPIVGSSSSRKSVRKSTVIVSKTAVATVPASPSAALGGRREALGQRVRLRLQLREDVVAPVELLEPARLLGLLEVVGQVLGEAPHLVVERGEDHDQERHHDDDRQREHEDRRRRRASSGVLRSTPATSGFSATARNSEISSSSSTVCTVLAQVDDEDEERDDDEHAQKRARRDRQLHARRHRHAISVGTVPVSTPARDRRIITFAEVLNRAAVFGRGPVRTHDGAPGSLTWRDHAPFQDNLRSRRRRRPPDHWPRLVEGPVLDARHRARTRPDRRAARALRRQDRDRQTRRDGRRQTDRQDAHRETHGARTAARRGQPPRHPDRGRDRPRAVGRRAAARV